MHRRAPGTTTRTPYSTVSSTVELVPYLPVQEQRVVNVVSAAWESFPLALQQSDDRCSYLSPPCHYQMPCLGTLRVIQLVGL